MRGVAQCRLVGGPADGEVIELAPIQCLDRLEKELESWLEARADGGANVMRGRRPSDANWEAYTQAVYEKDPPTAAGGVTYRF